MGISHHLQVTTRKIRVHIRTVYYCRCGCSHALSTIVDAALPSAVGDTSGQAFALLRPQEGLQLVIMLQQVSGEQGGDDQQAAAGGQIKAFWHDEDEEELHMEDSM